MHTYMPEGLYSNCSNVYVEINKIYHSLTEQAFPLEGEVGDNIPRFCQNGVLIEFASKVIPLHLF